MFEERGAAKGEGDAGVTHAGADGKVLVFVVVVVVFMCQPTCRQKLAVSWLTALADYLVVVSREILPARRSSYGSCKANG